MTINQENACLAVAAFAMAGALSCWITERARIVALRRGVLAQVSERSSHSLPTPRLGGVGLALGFGIGLALIWWLADRAPWMDLGFRSTPGIALVCLATGWAGMFLTGLADDIKDLRPQVKLACMSVAGGAGAIGFWIAGGSGDLSVAGQMGVGIATLVWILFFTNAYNFMDGLDGLAGTFALIVGLTFALILQRGYAGGLALLPPMALAGAAGGFLIWNRPPARVFMGDAGSLSTGYALACFAMVGSDGRGDWPLPAHAAGIALMPFIFDVVLTLIRRARRGENVMRAHREHLYQRVQQTGLSHGQALRIHLLMFCAYAVLAVLSVGRSPLLSVLLALIPMVCWWRLVLARERTMGPGGGAAGREK